ncbi:MAG: 1-deoxy-D-xylulose-5-phosphate synthase [Steroidobacteraceae bacterium]
MTTRATPLLDAIAGPADLRRLPRERLAELGDELRAELLNAVSRSGGHLAAGLGTVELAIALHYVYDTPADRIVWDVGHQAYPHKVLTGRRDGLGSIRRRGGLSGFLKREESEHDAFGAGHSSTSISAALGFAVAAAQRGESRRSVAVIGDGALTAGLAYEALHHAGGLGANVLVVLNDNGMSISPNVGAMAGYLDRLSGRDGSPHPDAGRWFDDIGIAYTGPVDGHDVAALVSTLETLRDLPGPRLLHVVTRKGHGYGPAEADPVRYHGVTPFDPAQPLPAGRGRPTCTEIFGQWLCDAADADPDIVAVTPAMREGSGLVGYAARHPDRYFDVGIAEQHAVTYAAGLAAGGLRPVVAIYSTFLQRGYDQLLHDVALQKLPVTFAIDRAGVVGPDGATHNGCYDLSYLRCVPGMVVMTPSGAGELRDMLETAVGCNGPAAVRYPRAAPADDLPDRPARALPIGRAITRRRGREVAFLVFGTLLDRVLEVAEAMDATVVDMRFVKPLDESVLVEVALRHELVVTVEENVVQGGAGGAVNEALHARGMSVSLLNLGLPDRPLAHGTRDEVLAEAGLDARSIMAAVSARLPALTSDFVLHPLTLHGPRHHGRTQDHETIESPAAAS